MRTVSETRRTVLVTVKPSIAAEEVIWATLVRSAPSAQVPVVTPARSAKVIRTRARSPLAKVPPPGRVTTTRTPRQSAVSYCSCAEPPAGTAASTEVGANAVHQAAPEVPPVAAVRAAALSSRVSVSGRCPLPPLSGRAVASSTASTVAPAERVTYGPATYLVPATSTVGTATATVAAVTGRLPLAWVRGVTAEVSVPSVVVATVC